MIGCDRVYFHGILAGMDTVEQRFWAKVNQTETCWLWLAATDRAGYGVFSFNQKPVRAHRFAYELLVGPIPEGLELDHVKARGCTNRNCVNPAHLEPVTHAENCNNIRSDGGKITGAKQRSKTHCIHGHEYTPENTYLDPRNERQCRACGRARTAAYLRRKRATAGVEASDA